MSSFLQGIDFESSKKRSRKYHHRELKYNLSLLCVEVKSSNIALKSSSVTQQPDPTAVSMNLESNDLFVSMAKDFILTFHSDNFLIFKTTPTVLQGPI